MDGLLSLSLRDGLLGLIRDASRAQIDGHYQDAYAHLGAGRLKEEHFAEIDAAVAARRKSNQIGWDARAEHGVARAVAAAESGVQSARARSPVPRVVRSPVVRSPDEIARRERELFRRHATARCLSLQAGIAGHFRTAASAVLARIARAHRQQGYCDLPVAALAAAAHCSVRAVQAATALAERLGIIRIERQRRAPNRITVIGEWAVWLRRSGSQGSASDALDADDSAQEKSLKKKEKQFVSDSGKGAKTRVSDPPGASFPDPETAKLDAATTPEVDRGDPVAAPPDPAAATGSSPSTVKSGDHGGILTPDQRQAHDDLARMRQRPIMLAPLRYVRPG